MDEDDEDMDEEDDSPQQPVPSSTSIKLPGSSAAIKIRTDYVAKSKFFFLKKKKKHNDLTT